VVQWSVFAFLAVITVANIPGAIIMSAKGVPTTPYFLATAVFAVVTTVLIPPLFFRLPKLGKIAGYLALIPTFIAMVTTFGMMDAAYLQTPAGKAAAEAEAASEAIELRRAQVEEDRQSAEKAFERIDEDRADMHRGVERCINWRGQIPSLVTATKEALHNPRSFEHVKTEVVTVGATPAVKMEYRAENGFGAIRVATINAFISPEDCSVIAAENSVNN
jgi:hypothetical protein